MCYNDYLKEVVKLPVFTYDFETDGILINGICPELDFGLCDFMKDLQIAPCIGCPLKEDLLV